MSDEVGLADFIAEEFEGAHFFRLVFQPRGTPKFQRVSRIFANGETSPEDIAARFKARADSFADDAQEQLAFRAVSYSEGGELGEMFPFPAGDADLFQAGGGAPDDVSSMALRRTLQREKHIDTIARETVKGLRGDLKDSRARNAKLERIIDEGRDKREELTAKLETAKTEEHIRAIATNAAAAEGQTRSFIMGKIQDYMPMFASWVTGGSALAQFIEGLDQVALDEWLGKFSDKDLVRFEQLVKSAESARLSTKKITGIDTSEPPPKQQLKTAPPKRRVKKAPAKRGLKTAQAKKRKKARSAQAEASP